MRHVINLIFVSLFLTFSLYGQKAPEKLKQEQRKLEKKITQTKALLKSVQANSKASLQEVALLNSQIKDRENLVRVFDSQVRGAEYVIANKKKEIERLQRKLLTLKNQYTKIFRYAYKRRNNSAKLMYLLSSKSYQEALRRNSYLRKISQLQKRQVQLILQHQKMMEKEVGLTETEKLAKEQTLNEKKEEKLRIEADRQLKEKSYNKLKKDESNLLAQLKESELKRKKIESQIQSAILAEIQREEAKKQKAEAKKSKSPSKTETKTPQGSGASQENNSKYKPEVLSSEGSLAGKNFESNKGKLPTPVVNASVTSKFGKNAHPSLKEVYENNNGIDLTCSAGSSVRAVFDGEVSSVFNISGGGKVVIIKHGNYRSVYSNLSNVHVSVGQTIKSKQNLGTLISEGNISILHFEIHAVSGINTTPLNPSLWLSR